MSACVLNLVALHYALSRLAPHARDGVFLPLSVFVFLLSAFKPSRLEGQKSKHVWRCHTVCVEAGRPILGLIHLLGTVRIVSELALLANSADLLLFR